jgi:hypothetical protein
LRHCAGDTISLVRVLVDRDRVLAKSVDKRCLLGVRRDGDGRKSKKGEKNAHERIGTEVNPLEYA